MVGVPCVDESPLLRWRPLQSCERAKPYLLREQTHGEKLLRPFWGCRHTARPRNAIRPQLSTTDHRKPLVKLVRTTNVLFEATRLTAQLEQTSLRERTGCRCSWDSIEQVWSCSVYHLFLYRLSEGEKPYDEPPLTQVSIRNHGGLQKTSSVQVFLKFWVGLRISLSTKFHRAVFISDNSAGL